MTCQEIRWYFEDHLRDAEVRSDRGAVAEHVSTCADCAQYVAEHRALGRSLRLVRETAPAVPESLDAAVVTRCRQHLAQRRDAPSAERGHRLLPTVAWAWGVAAAVVLTIAAFWFFSPSHKATSTLTSTPNPRSDDRVAPAASETPAAPATGTAKNHVTPNAKTHRPRTARGPGRPVLEAKSLPEGFRSLMYCDALSCPSGMDMIRVQLPASAMARQVPGFIQTRGSVTADVLVGPDGIARGIRLEEIEF
jgi:hypothetical protein